MLILHASALGSGLVLWGESPPSALPVRKGRSRRPPPGPPLSPFDPGELALRAALTAALPERVAPEAEAATPLVWLPSTAVGPLASGPLIAEAPPDFQEPALAAWRVSALRPALAPLLDLLCRCADRTALAPGVVVGATLAFWAVALRLAGGLVARQQFWPSLRREGDGWCARWQSVVAGPDAARLTALVRAMPAACRALSAADALQPPAVPARTVLTAFLDQVADHLVRLDDLPARPGQRPARPKEAKFDSLHDQWLHALRTPDGRLSGRDADLSRFAAQVREWQRPVALGAAAPFRLCLRLEEPDGTDDPDSGACGGSGPIQADHRPWFVRYLLQAADDPSLLVPAADVWRGGTKGLNVLKRDGFQPREYLLAALGQAAAIDADVERGLHGAVPAGHELDVSGAHAFLTERAAVLESAGFGVLLPAWWTRKGTKERLSVRAHVRTPKMSGSGLNMEDLVRFEWKVALGEQPLTLRELQALARLKTPLIRVRGQWVQLSAAEIQAAIDFWKQKNADPLTVRDAVRLALGADRPATPLQFAGVVAEGGIGDFLQRLERREPFVEETAPPGFGGTLRPYQLRGFSWLSFLGRLGLGACLADDMGLGKTVQTLAHVLRRWKTRPRPTLLICPTSVVGNWHKEASRFAPQLPVLVHHGPDRLKGAPFNRAAQGHALVLSSYALLHRDLSLFKPVAWDGVVLDEAQNVKNPLTRQSQAARSLKADWRAALTGTPVENHVGDLWAIMEFLNPGFLGTQADFRRSFYLPIQADRDPEAAARLKRLTGPFVLRRVKTDKSVIADLPDKLEMKVYCTLTREQASLYAAVVAELEEAIGSAAGIQRKGLVLGALSKLKQVCNHPAHFLGDNSAIAGRSGKLTRLTEMLEEVLEVGERALIFTQFTEMGDILQRHLQETFGREVLFLHGGVTKKKRDTMVERFQAGGPSLFLLSLKAGGTGLNLTAANHVFHFDRWWNPAVENQATDRAFRIGQTRNVQVHKFLCVGTLEEKIDEMIERKREVAGLSVGSGEAWLTELSTGELKDLFRLRREALEE